MRLGKRHLFAVSGLQILDGLSSTGKHRCCSASVCFFERTMLSVHRWGRRSSVPGCWTYSHHCQIADKNPSKDGLEISGVSYMCWIDFHNGIWGCGFLCARLITLYFVSIFCFYFTAKHAAGYHAQGYHAPSIPHGPPRLYHHCTAITSVYIPATTPRATTPHTYHHGLSRLSIHPGYHTRTITLHNTRTSGYHTRY